MAEEWISAGLAPSATTPAQPRAALTQPCHLIQPQAPAPLHRQGPERMQPALQLRFHHRYEYLLSLSLLQTLSMVCWPGHCRAVVVCVRVRGIEKTAKHPLLFKTEWRMSVPLSITIFFCLFSSVGDCLFVFLRIYALTQNTGRWPHNSPWKTTTHCSMSLWKLLW